MCGVPYGVIDVDRLLTSLTLAPGGDGHPTLALHEKGLAALESLLFAKYQMYRNVYWHHAVRSATSMFKRLVRRAIAGGRVRPDAVAVATDGGLIHELLQQDVTGLARSLRERRLAKRALDLPATELPADTPSWPSDHPALLERGENRPPRRPGVSPGARARWRVPGGAAPRRIHGVGRDDDARDVAGPAVTVCLGDQIVHLFLGHPICRQELRQLGVFEHPRQTVRGEQEPVPRLHGAEVNVRHHIAVRAHTTGDHVRVRVGARLLRGEIPRVDLLLDVRVIFGQL